MLEQKLEAKKLAAQAEDTPAEPQQLGATTATESSYPLKLSDIPKDDQGEYLVQPEQLQKLEDALSKGTSDFSDIKWAMVDATEDHAVKMAIVTTANLMHTAWEDSKKLKLTHLQESDLPVGAQGDPCLLTGRSATWKRQPASGALRLVPQSGSSLHGSIP